MANLYQLTALGEASERMRRMEAEANARLGGVAAPAPAAGDLESQALARLNGGSPASSARPLDPEAQAIAALQANTERAKVDEENRRHAQLIAEQQAETDRLQRELEQSNAPPQESTAAILLRSISGAIAQNTASQAQSQTSISQATEQQLATLHSLQQQIAANQAAEQQRRTAVLNSTSQQAVSPGSAIASPVRSVPPQSGLKDPTVASPSYSTVDSHGAVTLGTGSLRACATSPSGSQLPLTPGTTATTCTPASCRDMGYSVHFDSRWTDATKSEVVGFFDNNSIGDATCTWAFHKHGIWTEPGSMVVKAGIKHKGGEFGGIWTTDADSSTIQYMCFEEIDLVDEHGVGCSAHVHFAGQTNAGTDK